MIYLWYSIFVVSLCDIVFASMTQPEYTLLLAKARAVKKARNTDVFTDFDVLQEYSQQMNNTHQYGLPKCQ